MDIRANIIDFLASLTKEQQADIAGFLEVPPQSDLGDFAFPCFRLARIFKKSPVIIAQDLAAQAAGQIEGVKTVKAVNGYLNFFADRALFVKNQVRRTLAAADRLGSQEIGQGKTVIVEYSSPNIAKPFHVGHAFTTILGNALYRIYDRLGYQTVRVNHLGDYGTQFGKLIVAYRLWVDEKKLACDPIKELLRIYVKFHEEALTDPELEQQARVAFQKLEQGEEAEKELWQRMRTLSLKEFETIYERLGVSFDSYRGESFYSDQIPEVVDYLRKKDILTASDGAQIVHLDEYGLPPCIILKSDGTTIYASRDIAAVLYRWQKYHFAKNLYVVGSTQSLHFKQVFAVLDKAGFTPSGQCQHIGFGLVKFPDRKLSTRSGDVVLLADLLDESVNKTREIILKNKTERQLDLSDKEIADIAEKVGIGAVIYTFLKSGREHDIVFSWDEMLDFEGDTAPYVQYTYARARSILRKADAQQPEGEKRADLKLLTGDDEFELAKHLATFDQAILTAERNNEPYVIVRYVTLLARLFNKYYHNEPILKTADSQLRLARLQLLEAVCLTLKSALELVGISVVERM